MPKVGGKIFLGMQKNKCPLEFIQTLAKKAVHQIEIKSVSRVHLQTLKPI